MAGGTVGLTELVHHVDLGVRDFVARGLVAAVAAVVRSGEADLAAPKKEDDSNVRYVLRMITIIV